MSTSDLSIQLHNALKLWHKDPAHGSPIAHLTLVQRGLAAGYNLRQATNQALLDGLEALQMDFATDAQLLRKRFLDDKPAFAVANELNMAEATLFKAQRRALDRLAEVIQRLEQAANINLTARAVARLPQAPYSYLIGVEPYVERLSAVLQAADMPALVALQGMGGIGKSSLAHRLATHLALEQGTFAEVAWISAQQRAFHTGGFIQPIAEPALSAADLIEALAIQLLPADALPVPFVPVRALPALRARLHATPTLVVVDNLETLADVDALLPTLRSLAGPSRFLLTSRHALHREPDLYPFTVPELSEADALRLLRREAQLRNLPDLLAASDQELHAIYETVGGNPLALKLVCGQLFLLPLPQVLDALRTATGQHAEALYRYMYWTSWRLLSADDQEVLLTMPLFGQAGADLAGIARACDVQGDRLVAVLEHLAQLSLVNVTGDLYTRRYGIHRLTETWLRQEVIGWESTAGEDE